MKKLVLGIISLAVLVLSAPALFFATPAEAKLSSSYHWLDEATIVETTGNITYINPDPNNTSIRVYYRDRDPDVSTSNDGSCTADALDIPDGNNKSVGSLVIVSSGVTSGNITVASCPHSDPIRVSLLDTSAASAIYSWVDGGTIRSIADSKFAYSVAAGNHAASGNVSIPTGSGFKQVGTTKEYRFTSTDGCNSSITVGKSDIAGTIIFRGRQGSGCFESPPQPVSLARSNLAALPAGTGTPPAPTGTTTDGPQCDAGGGLTWILCPIISTAESAIGSPPLGTKPGTGLEGVVSSQLTYSILSDPSGKSDVKAYWQAMTYLADVFFIVLFFIVIFGTALGLDNYTVKKILPRLIAAAILIQFSFLLCGLAVDISNVLGQGIPTILHTALPSHSSADSVGGVNAVFLATGIAGGGALLVASPEIIIPLLLLALSAVISLLTIFFTLEIRIILITVCVILAPVMILLWVLPNTQSIFKRWWRLFMGMLVMYPLITLLISVGDLMTHLTQAGANSTFGKIMFSLAPIFVFFLIPMTFKAAGSLFALAGGKIGSLGDKASGKVDKARGASMARGKEERKLKSAETLASPDSSKFSKAMAARRGGFKSFVPGVKQSDRQIAAQSKAVEDFSTREQGKYASEIIRSQQTPDQVLSRALGTTNRNEKRASVESLVKSGSYDKLQTLLNSRNSDGSAVYEGGATNAKWQALMDKHKRAIIAAGHGQELLGVTPQAQGGGQAGQPPPAP